MNRRSQREYSHTFAICAYKESPYLEECVQSLLAQTRRSPVIMCTSTPCPYISDMAEKYQIPLYVREGESDIRKDWNFAYDSADTDFVTVTHQDDVYAPGYVEAFYQTLQKSRDPSYITMYLTDYLPLKAGDHTKRDINSRIRRLLRTPLKMRCLSDKKWIKKGILAFGNAICCPTVTYNKARLGDSVFVSEYKFNIDWDTFFMLAKQDGMFAYCDRPLVYYRVHDGATSMAFIENHLRVEEDTRMFEQFWPAWFAKWIMKFYKRAYDTYSK